MRSCEPGPANQVCGTAASPLLSSPPMKTRHTKEIDARLAVLGEDVLPCASNRNRLTRGIQHSFVNPETDGLGDK